jgi:hypothetical protein
MFQPERAAIIKATTAHRHKLATDQRRLKERTFARVKTQTVDDARTSKKEK